MSDEQGSSRSIFLGNEDMEGMDEEEEMMVMASTSEGTSRAFGRSRPSTSRSSCGETYQFEDLEMRSSSETAKISVPGMGILPANEEVDYLTRLETDETVVFRKKNFRRHKKAEGLKEDSWMMEFEENGRPKGWVESCVIDRRKFSGKMIHGITGTLRFASENPFNYPLIVSRDEWSLVIEGPKGSYYEGGVLFATLCFVKCLTDPAKHNPNVVFNTMIFHPNVDSKGNLDMRRFMEKFQDTGSILNVYQYIFDELSDVKVYPEHCYQPLIQELIEDDPERFGELARGCNKYTT